MLKKLKKWRKELEKWLGIPKILLLNKQYVSELKTKDEIIEKLNTKIEFVEVNNNKLNHQVIQLKKKEDNDEKNTKKL